MKLNGFWAAAAGILLCIKPAYPEVFPSTSSADTTEQYRIDDYIAAQLELIAEFSDSIRFVHLDEEMTPPSVFEFGSATVEARLAFLQKTVPLSYNVQVQHYIDLYSTDRYKRYLSRMMGLGAYYFPIYERIFNERGVPEELKYLSIVESALNPHAVSRVGATGLWQFMFSTARLYNLTMDSYVDERKDPIAASYAAAAYFQDAYAEFGDWLLAIAAYNCGKGNVQRAIERSGLTDPDFWSISAYLPKETRNYVPAFIAMTYMMGYHEEHGIEAEDPAPLVLNTDSVWVHKAVPFRGVADALGVEEELIRTLNPAYKRGLVNGTAESPRRLILPEVPPSAYGALYAALNHPTDAATAMYVSNPVADGQTIVHRVRKGETLGGIANRYGVTVQDLRVWNNLRKNLIVAGQRLRIETASTKSESHATSRFTGTKGTYTVKKGDTLSGIAKRYRGVTVASIKAANGLKDNTLRPGMVLKIM